MVSFEPVGELTTIPIIHDAGPYLVARIAATYVVLYCRSL